MKAKAKIVAAYIRVSTTGQNEAGQRAEIKRWLSGNGIDGRRVRWYVEKISADSLKRPQFERLQAEVFAGEIGTIVVFKLDRISRNLRDGINTLGGWCEKGIRVVATSQQLDFNGSVGQLVAAVLWMFPKLLEFWPAIPAISTITMLRPSSTKICQPG